MGAIVVLGIVTVGLSTALAIALNKRDGARSSLAEEKAVWQQLLSDAMQEIEKLRAELESDDRLRGLQERNSALLDENRTLRLRVEQMDESDDVENAIELARKHDTIGMPTNPERSVIQLSEADVS